MLYQMSDYGICASSGSACTSGSLEPSHVLRAMKIPDAAVQGSVRFSFSRYNTDADVDRIIEVFPGNRRQRAAAFALLGPREERPAGRLGGVGSPRVKGGVACKRIAGGQRPAESVGKHIPRAIGPRLFSVCCAFANSGGCPNNTTCYNADFPRFSRMGESTC